MPVHPQDVGGSIHEAVRASILEAIPDASVEVQGGGGHFTIDVVSPIFGSLNRVKKQQVVLRAIRHLMDGAAAPVHAVDTLTTRVPE
jgi:acid stress-induced BolA-like protein IbaG/YrbA